VQICRNYEALGYRYPGGFAQYLAVPTLLVNDGSVNRVPNATPSWAACLAEPLACTLNAQEAMGIQKGDTVLIVGAGPMGSLHLLLARQRGALVHRDI
jgi:L-iditol 2-dehydrogenase